MGRFDVNLLELKQVHTITERRLGGIVNKEFLMFEAKTKAPILPWIHMNYSFIGDKNVEDFILSPGYPREQVWRFGYERQYLKDRGIHTLKVWVGPLGPVFRKDTDEGEIPVDLER